MPRADNVPSMIIEPETTPSVHGLGVKGCGEAGAIATSSSYSLCIGCIKIIWY